MSKRRWAIRERLPIALVAVLPVLFAGALVGCAGGPRGSSGPWGQAGSPAPVGSSRPVSGRPLAAQLAGTMWLAQGPQGWEAGAIGEPSIALGAAEVGIAATADWVVSATLRPTDAITLLVRAGLRADPKRVSLGSLAPTATVVVGGHAYVSGFSFADPTDPGILRIDLATAVAEPVLPPSRAIGTRYLAVSADGSTLVSSLCDQTSNPEPETCAVTVISLPDGTPTSLGDIQGGVLRAASSEVAIVAPHSHEAPEWIAGVDLRSGTELWRLAGGELGGSILNPHAGLIQERIRIGGPTPTLLIEAIDLRTGAARVVYREARESGRSLWPALCSDDFIVLGDDTTGSRALAGSADGRASIRLVPLDGGEPLDLPISLRTR